MIELNSDLLSIEEGIIIHGCNCSGGFGTGIAGAIKAKWPEVEKEFRKHKPDPSLLGTWHITQVNPFVHVINAYTQLKYGYDGKQYADPKAIDKVLNSIAGMLKVNIGRVTFHIPRIGCTRGGLNWETDVKPIIEQIEKDYNVQFVVHNWTENK